MALKPEASLPIALATAAIVWAVYAGALPTSAAVRSSTAANPHLDSARRTATVESIFVVSVISLLAKDPTVFLVGGIMVIIQDGTHRHANAVDKNTPDSSVPVSASASLTAGPVTASAAA